MHCSHCGICCEKTEMMLSNMDIEQLEGMGYDKRKFVRYDRYGFARLKNRYGVCVFYDAEKCRCKVYEIRPVGCRIYPVIYSEREGIVVDTLCPLQNTISKREIKREGKKLIKLLWRIDSEALAR